MKKGTAIRLIAFVMLLFSLIPAACAQQTPKNVDCTKAEFIEICTLKLDLSKTPAEGQGEKTAALIVRPEEADINKIFAEELSKRPELKGYTDLVKLNPRVYKYSVGETPIKQTCTPLVGCTGWSDCLWLKAIPAMVQSERFVSPTNHLRRCKVVKKCIESTGVSTESEEGLLREARLEESCILSGRLNAGISQGGIAATFLLREKKKPKETPSLTITLLPAMKSFTPEGLYLSAVAKNLFGGFEIQGKVEIGEDKYNLMIAKRF